MSCVEARGNARMEVANVKGAHVFVPKDWLGKKVKVTLIEEE
ncbi:MAG: DUF2080 family transposase-associated protein [Nitrososphaera sp.]